MVVFTVTLNACVDRILEVPNLQVGAHAVCEVLDEVPAGKGLNVAHVLHALGADVRVAALLGADRMEWFRDTIRLPENHVQLHAGCRRTRINTTLLDPVEGTETHLREAGSPPDPAVLGRLMEGVCEQVRSGDWVALCGSLPPGMDAQELVGWIHAFQARGARVAVDAFGSALLAAVEAGADLIKPNRQELTDLSRMPAHSEMHAMAEAVRLRNPDLHILGSDGEYGCCLCTPESCWQAVAAHPVPVRGTVGAGDALLAGFLWGLGKNLVPTEALRKAVEVACAALAYEAAGTLDPAGPAATVNVLALGRTQA